MTLLMMTFPMLMLSLFFIKNFLFIHLEIPFFLNSMWNMKISIILDWISCSFSTTVMFITSMILLYSMTYMPKTQHNQFMLIMMMFVLSMIMLILSNNLIFMLLGWDGLGISSYILVILYQNPKSGASGSITMLSNRVGDALIIISISLILMSSSWSLFMISKNSKLILILMLMASCTKSAQFPFSAWLPAAMAAPTPISALVHSSTLVTAGVFLMIRLTQYNSINIIIILMILSSATAIYASMTACWEQDMKKIIAYSTLSQIAMMMFITSLSNPNIAYFHLVTHALFKSMMFMTAGIIIMNSSYQDMRSMGSMMKNSPIVSSSLGISMMALMGLPFMSGFFSKDMILEMMMKSHFVQFMSILMISSVGMTVTYSLRTTMLTFKMMIKSLFASSPSILNMEIPLMIMAPMSIITGAMLSWMMFCPQNIILPLKMKLIISTILLISISFSLNMKFLSLKFLSMGKPAISIWFIHILSSLIPNKPLLPIMKILNFDKNWQEMYGPFNMYMAYKNIFLLVKYPLMTPMFMMLILSIPLLILLMII
uniref:NADH:ubiquinone reductase (H(+)-translocating) n=1 Tax=Tetragnatha maxillosa TaxID=216284 RepID=A0A0A0YQ23_9ARAC|nr:NADH dehydrogenase subunit 5 [Tetragnatha maxillosa]AIX11771.1 NADH dehydrogenase subunit 5 [Tetragnatha maxillosa]